MTAVRSFTLRDSLSLHKLIGRGISFDSGTSLTRDLHLLRNAFLANLLPELLPETLVLNGTNRTLGFAQLSHRRGTAAARLQFLAPREICRGAMGSDLIEALLRTAGRRQAQQILADAEDKSEECGFLRREGFSIYARQDIWKGIPPFPQSDRKPPGTLGPLLPAGVPSVHALYCSIVPALVHQVEGFPHPPRGWMLFEEGELVGFFHLRIGSRGLWMEPFFHPGAHHAAEWIAAWLGTLRLRPQDPVYLCVRSYQDWVGSILQDFGFSLFSRRSVLARRVVVTVPILEGVPLPVVEKPATQATTYTPSVTQKAYDSATANHR